MRVSNGDSDGSSSADVAMTDAAGSGPRPGTYSGDYPTRVSRKQATCSGYHRQHVKRVHVWAFSSITDQRLQDNTDYTPDYTVSRLRVVFDGKADLEVQDSDTQPNTTASSVAGDTSHTDGRKKRVEANQLRKSVLGKKHNRLHESKVRLPAITIPRL